MTVCCWWLWGVMKRQVHLTTDRHGMALSYQFICAFFIHLFILFRAEVNI